MGTNILDASSLQDKKQQDNAQSSEAIEKADGYAQVFPEDKFHIIEVLQKRGHFVGMTGDGVNDAPALKQADCGIAVSGATDAARAAASIVLLAPGLSVIIDAIKEARRIVQRMNSYAIYRIAETLRVLLFMVLAILVFNFYPVTAVMIVMIAVLNDGAILSIAYDNVHYKKKPEAWNMRLVLGIATVLGIVGPVAAFGLFLPGRSRPSPGPSATADDDVFDAVSGRTSDHLPDAYARAVLVHPPCKDPVDRGAGNPNGSDSDCGVWAVYDASGVEAGRVCLGVRSCLGLLTDRVKLLGYRFLDHAKAEEPKPELKAGAPAQEGKATEPKPDDKAGQPKPEAKVQETKPAAKAETKPAATAEAKTEATAKTPADLEPQIAKLAYELYEERGRGESPAVQDWKQAERQIRKDEANSDPKAQAKAEPEPGLKPLR